MRLELSAFVEADLDAIAAFIADDNPGRAVTFIQDIRAKFGVIQRTPLLYQLRTDTGEETRMATVGHYAILLRVVEAVVRIERVVYGGRDLPNLRTRSVMVAAMWGYRTCLVRCAHVAQSSPSGTAHNRSPNKNQLLSGIENDAPAESLTRCSGEFPQPVEVALRQAGAGLHLQARDPAAGRFRTMSTFQPSAVRKCQSVASVADHRRWRRTSWTTKFSSNGPPREGAAFTRRRTG